MPSTVLIASLEVLSDPTQTNDTETLVRGTWEAFANPKAMAGLEILIATKAAAHRTRRATHGTSRRSTGNLDARIDTGADREHAVALGMVLWTTPVAMMIAEMFSTPPMAASDAQKAVVDLIGHHRSPAS